MATLAVWPCHLCITIKPMYVCQVCLGSVFMLDGTTTTIAHRFSLDLSFLFRHSFLFRLPASSSLLTQHNADLLPSNCVVNSRASRHKVSGRSHSASSLVPASSDSSGPINMLFNVSLTDQEKEFGKGQHVPCFHTLAHGARAGYELQCMPALCNNSVESSVRCTSSGRAQAEAPR